jgi:hypothetical protein
VHLTYFNTQDQPKFVWPASFVVARAYCDQLARSNGLTPAELTAVRHDLGRAEKLAGQARKDALTALAARLTTEAATSSDQWKVKMLVGTVTDLAAGGQ